MKDAASRGWVRGVMYTLLTFPGKSEDEFSYFTGFISVVIVLNTITLAIAYPGMSPELENSLSI